MVAEDLVSLYTSRFRKSQDIRISHNRVAGCTDLAVAMCGRPTRRDKHCSRCRWPPESWPRPACHWHLFSNPIWFVPDTCSPYSLGSDDVSMAERYIYHHKWPALTIQLLSSNRPSPSLFPSNSTPSGHSWYVNLLDSSPLSAQGYVGKVPAIFLPPVTLCGTLIQILHLLSDQPPSHHTSPSAQ